MALVGVHKLLLYTVALAACESGVPAAQPVTSAPSEIDGTKYFLPLPDKVEGLDPAKVQLGHLLFEEPLLSANGTRKCTSCHPLREAGSDGKRYSTGVKGALPWNTPTIYNLAFSFRFNWRGQFATLEDELDAPMTKAAMGNENWGDVVARLQKAGWDERFRKAGFDGVSEASIKKALATYERSLITPGARFDHYLKGDEKALNAEEKHGLDLFIKLGCVSCHQGQNIGGNMYQRIGVLLDYLSTRTDIKKPEKDRDPEDPDHLRLRVPSLRNIACTAPYLHDGTRQTLEEAIGIMGRHQIGRKLENDEVNHLKAFLLTLTGNYPDGTPVCKED
jgi:cytochrome c peroxidase